jgi:hypothetical protein
MTTMRREIFTLVILTIISASPAAFTSQLRSHRKNNLSLEAKMGECEENQEIDMTDFERCVACLVKESERSSSKACLFCKRNDGVSWSITDGRVCFAKKFLGRGSNRCAAPNEWIKPPEGTKGKKKRGIALCRKLYPGDPSDGEMKSGDAKAANGRGNAGPGAYGHWQQSTGDGRATSAGNHGGGEQGTRAEAHRLGTSTFAGGQKATITGFTTDGGQVRGLDEFGRQHSRAGALAQLGFAVGSTPSMDEIKAEYRRRAKSCHPDKNVVNNDACVEDFQRLNGAYQMLTST